MKSTLLLLAASAFAFLTGLHADVRNGEPAPDFKLTDINGAEHSLSDYKGRYVVLEWINYSCPFVVKFYTPGKMQEWQSQLRQEGAVWLTIDSTGPDHRDFRSVEAHREMVGEWGIRSTAILPDPDGAVGRQYNARTTPHMYVIDPDGILRYQGAIDSIRSANQDDIEKADNYLLAAMHALWNGRPVDEAQTRPYGCTVHYAKETSDE